MLLDVRRAAELGRETGGTKDSLEGGRSELICVTLSSDPKEGEPTPFPRLGAGGAGCHTRLTMPL